MLKWSFGEEQGRLLLRNTAAPFGSKTSCQPSKSSLFQRVFFLVSLLGKLVGRVGELSV